MARSRPRTAQSPGTGKKPEPGPQHCGCRTRHYTRKARKVILYTKRTTRGQRYQTETKSGGTTSPAEKSYHSGKRGRRWTRKMGCAGRRPPMSKNPLACTGAHPRVYMQHETKVR